MDQNTHKNKTLVLILVALFCVGISYWFFIGRKPLPLETINVVGNPSCGLETCHGLDIACGQNIPNVCTMVYEIGDKCLQYAKCGVQNGECQQIQNTQFTQCKSCIQNCIDTTENDNEKLFECESKCN